MADEIAKFVEKFKLLKNAGTKVYLWIESEAGQAFVTLQAHLPDRPDDPNHRRHCKEDQRLFATAKKIPLIIVITSTIVTIVR